MESEKAGENVRARYSIKFGRKKVVYQVRTKETSPSTPPTADETWPGHGMTASPLCVQNNAFRPKPPLSRA